MKPKFSGKKIPKNIQKLIHSCLSLNPKERPTANQIIKVSEKHVDSVSSVAKYLSIIIVLGLITWGVYSITKSETTPIPIEETYKKALIMLNSDVAENVRNGETIMDSLANLKYAPAMYELARTYGWTNDSISLKRKRALGIIYSEEEYTFGMPMSDRYNTKASELYADILDLKDSLSSRIKAVVAYQLAMHSANENTTYRRDYKKAREYLVIAKKYAIMTKQDSLLSTIDRGILEMDKWIDKNK